MSELNNEWISTFSAKFQASKLEPWIWTQSLKSTTTLIQSVKSFIQVKPCEVRSITHTLSVFAKPKVNEVEESDQNSAFIQI